MAHFTADQIYASQSPQSEPALDPPLLDLYADSESRWKAVTTRDPASDCAFVYCVKTTNIYCRPVCKARLARRANVTFYDYPWQAQDAGFRACKRCKPDLIELMPAGQGVESIRKVVERSIANGEPLPRADVLARQTGLSKWHMQRKFKETYGVTLRQFSDYCAQGFLPGADTLLGSVDFGSMGSSLANTNANSPAADLNTAEINSIGY